jgi:hypothetical protein
MNIIYLKNSAKAPLKDKIMSASAYLLITNLFLIADGSQAGYGGADTEMQKFDTESQCEIAKNVFMNEMKVTTNEISGELSGVNAQVTRKAKCVNLNPVLRAQSSGHITLSSNSSNGVITAYRDGKIIDYEKISPEIKNSENVSFIMSNPRHYRFINMEDSIIFNDKTANNKNQINRGIEY